MWEILNQTEIAWLQVIFGNLLLYRVSVSDCLGTLCGIFSIFIIDIISIKAQVVFSLLFTSNYRNTKGPVCMYYCLTVIVSTVSYQYWSYLYYHDIHQCKYIFQNCSFYFYNSAILTRYILNCQGIFPFITNIDIFHLCYF